MNWSEEEAMIGEELARRGCNCSQHRDQTTLPQKLARLSDEIRDQIEKDRGTMVQLVELLDRAMRLADNLIDFYEMQYSAAEFAWIDHDFIQLTGHALPMFQEERT